MKVTISVSAFLLLSAVVMGQAPVFNPTEFPPVNVVPPVNSPQVQAWLKELNLADVPVFPKHTGNPPACPVLAQIPADQCWWTCQTCKGTDIESCPTPGTWGLTFDDGPTPQTIPLLQTLKTNNVKATFFVMGSNVVRNADVLKQEVAEGHHIASHTWSHHPLTTLSNEEIVAEIKWTEKAVMDITGLRMKYIRPPYGDIDNRVRAVVKKLGYIVIDWTSDDMDSKDFSLNAGYTEATLAAAVAKMTASLKAYAAAPGQMGIITLEHDLYPVTIEFAKRIIPVGAQSNLKVMSVAQCLGDANPYQAGSIVPPGSKPTPSGGASPSGAGPNGSKPSVLNPNSASQTSKTAGWAMVILAAIATLTL